MKKLLLSCLACGAFAATNAQGVLVYGSVGYNSDKHEVETVVPGTSTNTDYYKVKQFNFNPGVGYVVNPYFAVGIQANLGLQSNKTESGIAGTPDVDVRTLNLEGGLFFRGTKDWGKYFYSFTQLNLNYIYAREKTETTPSPFDPETKTHGFGAVLYPAIGIKLTPCTGLAFSFGGIGYSKTKKDNNGLTQTVPAGTENNDYNSKFFATIGQTFNLTLQHTFSKRTAKMFHNKYDNMNDSRRLDTSEDRREDSENRENRMERRRRMNDDN